MGSFSFKTKVSMEADAQASLSEQMSVKGDYVNLMWTTDFQGRDISGVKSAFRDIRVPGFNEEARFQKDVQIVVDENYMNYFLFSMLYSEKNFSLVEFIEKIAKGNQLANMAMRILLNTNVLGVFMPEIKSEFGNQRPVDLRCGMNKKFLQDHLNQQNVISSIKLLDGDRISAEMMLGCKIFVYDDGTPSKEYKGETDAIINTVSKAMNAVDFDPDNWKLFRSLFVDMSVNVKLDLSEKLKNSIPVFGDRIQVEGGFGLSKANSLIMVGLQEFRPHFRKIKVYNRDYEEVGEETKLQSTIDYYFENRNKALENPILELVYNHVFNRGQMPIIPYPTVSNCLDLKGADASIEIKEGYATIGLDFDSGYANNGCLFDMSIDYTGLEVEIMSKFRRDPNSLDEYEKEWLKKIQFKQDKYAKRGMPMAGEGPKKIYLYGHEVDVQSGVGGIIGSVGKIVTSNELKEDISNLKDGAMRGIDQFKNIIEGKERAPFHDQIDDVVNLFKKVVLKQ